MLDTTPTPHTVTERVAAPYTGVTRHTLRAWRRQGRGPAYLQLGRAIRYRIADLDEWLMRHRIEPRAEASR